jgi:hypothetical protein
MTEEFYAIINDTHFRDDSLKHFFEKFLYENPEYTDDIDTALKDTDPLKLKAMLEEFDDQFTSCREVWKVVKIIKTPITSYKLEISEAFPKPIQQIKQDKEKEAAGNDFIKKWQMRNGIK